MCDRTSSFKLSKSVWVRDKAMTSAPHSTNILAVLRPIPLNKIKLCIFATFPHSKEEETTIQMERLQNTRPTLKGRNFLLPWSCSDYWIMKWPLPSEQQAVHWQNRSKAFGSFQGTPEFSGRFQTEPPLPVGWVRHGRTLQSPWTQPRPWHASVCGKASERRNGNTTAWGGSAHFPARYTSPPGLQNRDNLRARYLSSASTP